MAARRCDSPCPPPADVSQGLQQAQAPIGLVGWVLLLPARYGKLANVFGLATTSELREPGLGTAVVTATVVRWHALAVGEHPGSAACRLLRLRVPAVASAMIRVRCFVFIFFCLYRR